MMEAVTAAIRDWYPVSRDSPVPEKIDCGRWVSISEHRQVKAFCCTLTKPSHAGMIDYRLYIDSTEAGSDKPQTTTRDKELVLSNSNNDNDVT